MKFKIGDKVIDIFLPNWGIGTITYANGYNVNVNFNNKRARKYGINTNGEYNYDDLEDLRLLTPLEKALI